MVSVLPETPTFLDENELDRSQIIKNNVSIIPVPFSYSVSWMTGTEKGPESILAASKALEIFDDELLVDTYKIGINTLPPLDVNGRTSEDAFTVIRQTVRQELKSGKLPVLLGGEHSITVPAVAACLEKYKEIHVLQIDAHLDLRDSYERNSLSHACVMRRLFDKGVSFTQVGIRSFSKKEWDFVQTHGLKPYLTKRVRTTPDWIKKICDEVQKPLYITVDVDGFDPSIMPATGTPEPDGLTWNEVTGLLSEVCGRKKVVGLDFVELAPSEGQHHASFTVAKLIYRTLGYIYKQQLETM